MEAWIMNANIIAAFRNYATPNKGRAERVLSEYFSKKMVTDNEVKQLATFSGLNANRILRMEFSK
jgi:hypothetical protein